MLSQNPSSRSSAGYAFPGAALAISANANTNGILWAVERNATSTFDQDSRNPGTLHAYDATNLAIELYNSNQSGSRDTLSPAAKYSIPLVANGKVFVATVNSLVAYGLIP